MRPPSPSHDLDFPRALIKHDPAHQFRPSVPLAQGRLDLSAPGVLAARLLLGQSVRLVQLIHRLLEHLSVRGCPRSLEVPSALVRQSVQDCQRFRSGQLVP